MNHHRLARTLAVAALLTATTITAHASTPVAAPRTPRPYDDALASVSARGFAGMWVDSARGTLVVALTHPDAATARAARADLARAFHRPGLLAMPVETRQARYTFRQLRAWSDAVSADVLALPGVVFADIDERADVLRFGAVDPAAVTARVTALAAVRHVPAAAVVVDRKAPEVTRSLDSVRRPLVGGIRIDGGIGTCSLGFAAVRGGVQGFVTASHCTTVEAQDDGTYFWQVMSLLDPTANRVAQETADPAARTTGCPGTSQCRDSDSAFADLIDDADFVAGQIARPATSGTTAWNGTDTYRVTSTVNPLLGDTVSKVGRTSGLTSGSVTATCVSVSQTENIEGVNVDRDISMTCQTQASYHGQAGDSGSPVFMVTSGNDVALAGVLWGGSTFSPLANIEESVELGSMSVCAPGFSC